MTSNLPDFCRRNSTKEVNKKQTTQGGLGVLSLHIEMLRSD